MRHPVKESLVFVNDISEACAELWSKQTNKDIWSPNVCSPSVQIIYDDVSEEGIIKAAIAMRRRN